MTPQARYCSWMTMAKTKTYGKTASAGPITDQLIGKLTEKAEAPWAGNRRGRGTEHETTSPVIDEGRREYLGVA